MNASTLVSILLEDVNPELLKKAQRTLLCSPNPEHVKWAIASGADVNAKNKYGETPLHYASEDGRTEIVKLLLQAPGINVNAKAKDKRGDTPLHYASFNGRTKVVKLLLAAPGINVNAKDRNRITPLHVAIAYSRYGYESTEEVVKLLKAAGGHI